MIELHDLIEIESEDLILAMAANNLIVQNFVLKMKLEYKE